MPACPAGHDSSAADFCDICGMRITASVPPGSAGQAGAAGAGGADTGVAGVGGAAAPAEPCPNCGTGRSGQFCEVCGFDFSSGRLARAIASPASPLARAGSQPAPVPDPPASAPGATVSQEPTSHGATGQGPTGEGSTGQGSTGQGSTGQAPTAAGAAWTAVVTADRAYYDRVIAAGGPDASAIEFPAYCPERRFRLSGREVRIGRRSVSRGLEPEIDLTGPPADPGISHLHAVLIAQPDGGWSVLDPGSSNGTQVNGADIATGLAVPLQPGDRVCIGAWTVLTIET